MSFVKFFSFLLLSMIVDNIDCRYSLFRLIGEKNGRIKKVNRFFFFFFFLVFFFFFFFILFICLKNCFFKKFYFFFFFFFFFSFHSVYLHNLVPSELRLSFIQVFKSVDSIVDCCQPNSSSYFF